MKAYSSINDRLLWEKMIAGNEMAFERLFRKFYPRLYDYGIKFCQKPELVKDSIQSLFLNIWKNRERLGTVESLPAYLIVSLRRQLLKGLRQQQARLELYMDFSSFIPHSELSPEERLIFRETHHYRQQLLKEALSQIPAKMRETLYLKTYQGLSYKEIATILGITPGVARNYMWEALKRIKSVISELQQH